MSCELDALCFAAADPEGLARFWAGVLDRERVDDTTLAPSGDGGFRLRFVPGAAAKGLQNRMHFDLTSTSPEDQQARVARALALGGRHHDVGQGSDEGHVVLADPEDNEFCVIEPGNSFTAGCGLIGALSSDGSQETGYFWSAALGWPLVWDQDEETAIQSPAGGPKIAWGGPPVTPKHGRNRLHLDLSLPAGADRDAEVGRLVSLGATVVATSDGRVELTDPDANEFCLLATSGSGTRSGRG